MKEEQPDKLSEITTGCGDNHESFAYAVYKIASSFASLDDVDTVINKAMESLGEACRAGRAYLFLFDPETRTMDNTHEWCAPGVEPQMEMLTDLPLAMFPWWMEKLGRGEQILIPEVRRLGPEAKAEKEILEEQSIESVLVLPVYEEKELTGFIGLDDVTSSTSWDTESQEYLRVASEMVGSTLTRAKRTREARKQTEELRTAYNELKETQAKLVQAEKLASIGMLAAGVAHEINNPLGFVKSNTNTLSDYLETVESIVSIARSGSCQEEFVEKVEEADLDFLLSDIKDILGTNIEGLNRITAIVRSLMGFARSGRADEFAESDINSGIENALTVAASHLRQVARVDFQPGELPPVFCNLGEMNQVFLNIIFNAVHAIEENHETGQGTIRIRTYAESGDIYCVFDDDGPGVPQELRGRLFEPFFTTKEVGEGTGLGMSIAYDIVAKKHEGEITVGDSDLGGARITLAIPAR